MTLEQFIAGRRLQREIDELRSTREWVGSENKLKNIPDELHERHRAEKLIYLNDKISELQAEFEAL